MAGRNTHCCPDQHTAHKIFGTYPVCCACCLACAHIICSIMHVVQTGAKVHSWTLHNTVCVPNVAQCITRCSVTVLPQHRICPMTHQHVFAVLSAVCFGRDLPPPPPLSLNPRDMGGNFSFHLSPSSPFFFVTRSNMTSGSDRSNKNQGGVRTDGRGERKSSFKLVLPPSSSHIVFLLLLLLLLLLLQLQLQLQTTSQTRARGK